MKKINMAVLFAVLSMVLSSCTGNGETPPSATPSESAPPLADVKPADYFPLQPGNQWKYLGDGNEYASFTREVLFAGGGYSQTTENNGGTVSSTVYLITDDQITVVYSKGEDYEPENLIGAPPNANIVIIKSPLEVGTTWGDEATTREIVSMDATVSTPLGDMPGCMQIKITDEYSYSYEYFKIGVGLVKREFHSDDTVISSTLEEMDLN
ncbi:MAG: hypothetical protein JXB33_05090 [Clostridia bacterium]|nr:hypothetical protein [Clostridia bacterium]